MSDGDGEGRIYTPLDGYKGIINYNFNEYGIGKPLAVGAVRAIHPRLHFLLVHTRYEVENEGPNKGQLKLDPHGRPIECPITIINKFKAKMVIEEAISMSPASHMVVRKALDALIETKVNVNINQMPMGFGGSGIAETAPTNLKFGDRKPGMKKVNPFEARTPGGQSPMQAQAQGGSQ